MVGWSRWLPRSTRTPATVAAGGRPPDDAGPLDQRDPVPRPRGPLGGAHPGGPRAQDEQVGVGALRGGGVVAA